MWNRVVASCVVLLSWPALALAQTPQPSSWGVVSSVNPEWKAGSPFDRIFGGSVDITGSDFSIGIARGRELSGDWGVSYVRQRWNNGSGVSDIEQDCSSLPNACLTSGEFYRAQNVVVSGIQAHKFIPFGTIKRRVQIGLNIAGGVGSVSGTVERHTIFPDVTFDRTGRATVVQQEIVETTPAKEELLSTYPMGKVQAAVAVIVARGLKVRFAGGIDFPGTNKFSVTGLYLFGTR
jgi:hypothetical protein